MSSSRASSTRSTRSAADKKPSNPVREGSSTGLSMRERVMQAEKKPSSRGPRPLNALMGSAVPVKRSTLDRPATVPAGKQKEKEQAPLFMEDDFCCPICQDLLVATRSLVPCGHAFCGHCILECLKVPTNNECPTCRRQVGAGVKTIPSFFLDGLVEKYCKQSLNEQETKEWEERKDHWMAYKLALDEDAPQAAPQPVLPAPPHHAPNFYNPYRQNPAPPANVGGGGLRMPARSPPRDDVLQRLAAAMRNRRLGGPDGQLNVAPDFAPPRRAENLRAGRTDFYGLGPPHPQLLRQGSAAAAPPPPAARVPPRPAVNVYLHAANRAAIRASAAARVANPASPPPPPPAPAPAAAAVDEVVVVDDDEPLVSPRPVRRRYSPLRMSNRSLTAEQGVRDEDEVIEVGDSDDDDLFALPRPKRRRLTRSNLARGGEDSDLEVIEVE